MTHSLFHRCAHDRFNLGKAGYGRLSIGLYVLYLEKWLEHFAPSQFLVLRLEDYDTDPKTYMERVFTFLSVEVDAVTEQTWAEILHAKHANEYHGSREPLLEETEKLLREFHEPYNKLLASLVDDNGFVWSQAEGTSLRIRQIEKDSIRSLGRGGGGGGAGGGVGGLEGDKGREKVLESNRVLQLRKMKEETFKARLLEQKRLHHLGKQGKPARLDTANLVSSEEEKVEGEVEEDNEVPPNLDRHGVSKHFVDDLHRRTTSHPTVVKKVKKIHKIKKAKKKDDGKEVSHKKSISLRGKTAHRHIVAEKPVVVEEGKEEGEGKEEDEIEDEKEGEKEDEKEGEKEGEEDVDREEASRSKGEGADRGDNRDKAPEVVKRNRTIEFTPRRFSVEGLSCPEDGKFNEWLSRGGIIEADKIFDELTAARQLNIASFGLDLAALRYLLWDTGVPPNLIDKTDGHRNALHCLCMVHTMSDAHSRSQVFAVLKGKPTWLTPYIQPPTPIMAHSVLSRDIRDGLSDAAIKAAQWLLRAGVDANAQDVAGYTPLHHAAVGGMDSLVRILLDAKVSVNIINREGRTPLHYAAAYGHAVVAGMLLDAGADSDIEDNVGTKASDIMSNPGPMSAEDAKKYLNIDQRPVRNIKRRIHPETLTNGEVGGWSAGTGGWGYKRLAGYEDDMSCDVDQYWADEISDEDIYNKYLARGAPVLIRGLIEDWPVVEKYAHDALRESFGHLEVTVRMQII